jgi:hypothetical protein
VEEQFFVKWKRQFFRPGHNSIWRFDSGPELGVRSGHYQINQFRYDEDHKADDDAIEQAEPGLPGATGGHEHRIDMSAFLVQCERNFTHAGYQAERAPLFGGVSRREIVLKSLVLEQFVLRFDTWRNIFDRARLCPTIRRARESGQSI